MTTRRQRSIAAGAAAGLVSGVISAGLLQVTHMLTPEGVEAPAMGLVAGALHTARDPLAWAGYLVYAVLIGAVFGWLLRGQEIGGSAVVWGILYGGFWWIVSGLVVIPALYGVGPMTPAAVSVIRNASLPWFGAMLLDGAALGVMYSLLAHQRPPRAETTTVTRRAA
jgi:hypothetical protein